MTLRVDLNTFTSILSMLKRKGVKTSSLKRKTLSVDTIGTALYKVMYTNTHNEGLTLSCAGGCNPTGSLTLV